MSQLKVSVQYIFKDHSVAISGADQEKILRGGGGGSRVNIFVK